MREDSPAGELVGDAVNRRKDHPQSELIPADVIVKVSDLVAPHLAVAVLEESPEQWDGDTWVGLLTDADSQASMHHQRSFDDPIDVLTILAHHDRHLASGHIALRASRAGEMLALLRNARHDPVSLDARAAVRFGDTAVLLVEAVGTARPDLRRQIGAAVREPLHTTDALPHDGAIAPDQRSSTAGNDSVLLELRSVRIAVEWWPVHNADPGNSNLHPVRGVRITNSSEDEVVVDTLRATVDGRVIWRGPVVRIPGGRELELEPSEIDWSWSSEADHAVEVELVAGAEGRSTARRRSLEVLPARVWAPTADFRSAALFVETAAPLVSEIVDSLPAELCTADDVDHGEPEATIFAEVVQAITERFPGSTGDAAHPGSLLRRLRKFDDLATTDGLGESERAVVIAAVLEALDEQPALIITDAGVRVGVGHSFDPDETGSVDARGAIDVELSRMVIAGAALTAESTHAIVDLRAARRSGVSHPVAAGTPRHAPSYAAGGPPRTVTRWKGNLLNLSFTNTLLRMGESSGATFLMPEDRLGEFEDVLSSGTQLQLLPHTSLDTSDHQSPRDDAVVRDLHDGVVYARSLSGGFDKRMAQLRATAARAREETGAGSLNIAIGTLRWETRGGKRGYSPLFLASVRLTGSARDGFRLVLDPGAFVRGNFALAEKLTAETGQEVTALVAPPTDGSGLDVEHALHLVEEQIKRLGIPAEIVRELRLVHASSSAQSMWRDLDENWRVLAEQPVANHLIHRGTIAFDDPVPEPPTTDDGETTTLVSYADSSQLDAVRAASNGRSFVLEGPPGTGKSETITNMIADGLDRGRTLLFVAEKKAALDVVVERLTKYGLHHLVLDAHDTKQSLNSVRASLRESLSLQNDAAGLDQRVNAARERVATIVRDLRTHPEALHAVNRPRRSAAGAVTRSDESRSPWELLQDCVRLESEFREDDGWQPEEIGWDPTIDGERTRMLVETAAAIRRPRRLVDGPVPLTEPESQLSGTAGDAVRSDLIRGLVNLGEGGLPRVAEAVAAGDRRGQLAEAIALAALRAEVAKALAAKPLSGSDGTRREGTVREYLDAVDELIALQRVDLAARVASRRHWNGKTHPNLPFLQEISRKRGGTVRALFTEFGSEILSLTPVVLMSPAGVSQHLPAGQVLFDTIIFDEASQVIPSHAIGALGRGRSAVIVGDPKQMPPPTEFTSGAATDEVEPGDAPADSGAHDRDRRSESILTAAADAGFVVKRLSRHYRSRNEKLIEFSNRTYYDGSLKSFPPPPAARPYPVRLVYVGGAYEKVPGSTKANPEEARAVVKEIRTILRERPDASILVVTFNSTQRVLVEAEIAATDDDVVVAALNRQYEPLVVKNVDNVQGDERDVVLFSTVYAPDRQTGKFAQNLGPLNRPGGEKRFNVAVTRARDEVVVLTSLRASNLDVTATRSKGVRDLRAYLETAERGEAVETESGWGRSDEYRASIAQELRNRGLDVVENVGSSSFVVDIAVRVENGHDEQWCALLLDGPVWAAMPTPWDRDGLAPRILETTMRWATTYRILATDWYRDSQAVVDHVVSLAASSRNDRVITPRPSTADGSVQVGFPSDREEVVNSASAEGGAVEATGPKAPLEPPQRTGSPQLDDPGPYVPRRQVPFVEADRSEIGSKDLFRSVQTSTAAKNAVRRSIEEVLETEGPTDLRRLEAIVTSRFGVRKRRQIDRDIVRSIVTQNMTDDGGVTTVWPDVVDPETYVDYRVPRPERPARNIMEISYRELGNAVVGVLRTEGFEMSENDLVAEVLGAFNVTGGTRAVRERVRDAIRRESEEDKVRVDFKGQYFAP